MENFEQKYKEALERARCYKGLKAEMETIFPELKESEDERIRKAIVELVKQSSHILNPMNQKSMIAWLEKQGEQKPIISDDAIREGVAHFGITRYQITNWLKKYIDVKKQGKQKPQGKPALDVWKDMRLEVYQQASGNRHEPNYSDDSTKMFSLTDIDEIFEKVAEKQGEHKPTDKVEPKFKVRYADSEYNVFETKDIAGVTFYGIEDEPNHIDYVKAENCERVGGYSIKENGSPYQTKPATFSVHNSPDELEKQFGKSNK